jgi:acyl dehydratase
MEHEISSFEDFKALAGLEVGVSDWLEVTQQQIDRFADLTSDFQWIHVDVERAKRDLPGGKTIAHGYLVLSLTPAMTADFLKFTNLERAINYGVNKVRFMNMVPVGCRIRARSNVEQIRKRSDAVQVIGQITVEIEGETKPACVIETVSFFYFKQP